MTWLSRLLALAAIAAPIHAMPLQYDFTGMVVSGSSPWAPANTPLSGYFRFDAATAPTSPGVWDLPTAVFHVDYAHLTIDTVEATAHVWGVGEAITFEADVAPSEFPFPNTGGMLDMQFETFIDNYFSTATLPTIVPPNDHSLFLWVDGRLLAGTDTAFSPVVHTPEPVTVAFFLAGLMGLAWSVRRRFSPKVWARSSLRFLPRLSYRLK